MPHNPFQQFTIGSDNNPLLSSMESLRKAWASMPNHPMTSMNPLHAQSTEELNKRITELQAVENWLALNLSMLRNTIQALEIQRSTLSAFQAFAQTQWPRPSEAEETGPATSSTAQAASSAQTKESDEAADTVSGVDEQALLQAGQAWWTLMQQQFQTLVQTTQSSMQAAQNAAEHYQSEHSPRASADSTFDKKTASVDEEAKPSTSTAGKKAAKKATKKTAKTAATQADKKKTG